MKEKKLTDRQIESLILNRLVNDNSYFDIVSKYNDVKFYANKAIPELNSIVIAFKEEYNTTPSTEVVNMIIEKHAKSSTFTATQLRDTYKKAVETKIDDAQFIQDNVLTYIKEKATYWTIVESIDEIQKNQDVSAIIEAFQEIEKVQIDQDLGFDYFADQDEHWHDILNPDSLLPTGFEVVDKATNGGFPSGGEMLAVYLAQANTGKSLMLSNSIINLLQRGKFCVLISLEMGGLIYGKRIDAHISLSDINQLAENAEVARERILNFKDLHEEAELMIKPFPPNSINTLHIQTYVEKLIQRKGRQPDAIFVDYAGLLQANSKSDSLYEKLGDVSRDLRAMSYVFRCPVITAAQTNRDGWDTSDVSMENIADSAQLAHTADFIGALWQAEGDREAGILHHTVIKNRFGKVGETGELRIDYSNLRITDKQISVREAKAVDKINDTLNELNNL